MSATISTSDPIFAALSVPAAFLADVVDLINRSPSLLGEIDQLDATTIPGGGTAEIRLQSGQQNGGNTYYHAATINIGTLGSYDDMTPISSGGSLVAGQTENITPAGTFVGVLAHEIAHWGDAQLGPLYGAGGLLGYPIEQAVATEFASEGKAATSQYTAMQQIQASEKSSALPADMANGNTLFDVDGIPAQDTVMLQTVQSIALGASPHAAEVSYLGSQFWNVPVDGGSYLTTMWGGYGAAGASDDLGISEGQITRFQVSESAAGTLAGCIIQTSVASGANLTYQIACAVPGSQQARITDTATGAAVATVDTVIAPAGGAQLTVTADDFSFAVIDDAVASVQGNDDTLALGSDDSLSLTGSGSTVTGAAGNTISLAASSSAVIAAAGGGGSIRLVGDAAAVDVLGTGARIALLGNNDTATASGSIMTLADAITGSLGGSSDTVILGMQDVLSLAGSQDTILLAGSAPGSESITLSGDQDRLFGGVQASDLRLTLSGATATVVLTGGHATISGANAGTTVFGGASDVDYAGGGILVMGSGAATVAGATAGTQQVVFGGASGLLYQGSQGYADVVGGAGTCTIQAGSAGGWYGGSAAGNNLLVASGAGTVLDAGGNGDTLVGAAGGGAYLIAAAGNETLRGGNQTGESTVFLGSGSDRLTAGPGGSIIDTGAGMATVYGGGGHDQIWAGSGGADLFVAGSGGQLEIHGFRTGTDHLQTAGQSISAALQSGGGTMFTLSSGATILLAGVDAPPGTVFA